MCTAEIITALLDNAIKFTDTGTVDLSVDGNVDLQGRAILTFTVTDTGVGIAPEDTHRIFERFTQQDGLIKRRHGGTGLGLTIARGLAELMNGEVTVQNDLNAGSSFTVQLQYETVETQAVKLQEATE